MFLPRRVYSLPQIQCNLIQVLTRFTSKIAVHLDDSVLDNIENNVIKPKKHPGIIKGQTLDLPSNIKRALEKVIGDVPIKTLLEDCQKLNRFIKARHPPPEQNEIETKIGNILESIERKMPREQLEELSEDEASKWKRKRESLVKTRLAQTTYAWKPITYGKYEALVYAIGRGAQEYAVLQQVLKEISTRDPEFKPKSYFDFGAGVGTGMWAVSRIWKESIYEYFNVDSSKYMNDLAELILRNGNENEQMTLRNVYFRQFLPGIHTQYDVVLSAFSLFELPNAEQRKDVVLNLWRKCDNYLILVEEGTRKGTELINEARELILSQQKMDLVGHVFAPCPHEQPCPRLAAENDNTPCNFELSYSPVPLGDFKFQRFSCRYSYVILKKGLPTDSTLNWPRIVRPTLIRSKHAICRMCVSEGKLQEVIFTAAKHGRAVYQCAKSSRWGDRLPITLGQYNKTRETKAEKIKAAKAISAEQNINQDSTKNNE